MFKLKIIDNPGLIKDKESNAVISVDKDSFNEYIKIKNKKLIESNRIDNLETKVENMNILLKKLCEKLL